MSGFPGNYGRGDYGQYQGQYQQQGYEGYQQGGYAPPGGQPGYGYQPNQGEYNQPGFHQGYPQGYQQGYQQGHPYQGQEHQGYHQSNYERPPSFPAQNMPSEDLNSHAHSQSIYQQDDPASGVQFRVPEGSYAPSTQPQSFGVDGYNYQYSNCTGRRKALLIGINYIGSKQELRGCINDVHNVKKFLLNNGFYEGDMVILTDDQTEKVRLPLRENIIKAIGWLVSDAQPNDSLFFHFSGHGSQQEDVDGDEEDGIDETIVPLDYETAGQIVDDELHARLVQPLKPGVRLTALFDSCHSGSVLDLPYTYSTKGVLKEPNLMEEAGSGLLDTAMSYLKGDTASVFKGIKGLVQLAVSGGSNSEAFEKTRRTKTSPADVVMFSGSKDNQTSSDAIENGVATGAMSYSFIKVMSNTPQQTYLSLLQNMREILEEKYSQKPQFSSSHPTDVNLKFII